MDNFRVGSKIAVYDGPTMRLYKGVIASSKQEGSNIRLVLTDVKVGNKSTKTWDRYRKKRIRVRLDQEVSPRRIGNFIRYNCGLLGKIYLFHEDA